MPTANDFTHPRTRSRRGSKRAEAKPWDPQNSDGTVNVGCYAVQAATEMCGLALELVADAGAAPKVLRVQWIAERLLAAADDIQAGVRRDGRSDRMANSYARAREVLRAVLAVVPFPIDAVNAAGVVPPDRADVVHEWHADVVNAGIALLSMAVDLSGVDWKRAA